MSKAIRRMFRIGHNRAVALEPRPSIFPGYIAPVVRKADNGERELFAFPGLWQRRTGSLKKDGEPTNVNFFRS